MADSVIKKTDVVQKVEPKDEGVGETALTFTLDELSDFLAKQVATALAGNRPVQLAQRQGHTVGEGLVICSECGQFRDPPEAKEQIHGCRGEHKKMVVYPSSEAFAQFFPGIVINHHRYCSMGPGHEITVPKEAANEISLILRQFEREETRNLTGYDNSRHQPMAAIGVDGSTQQFRAPPRYR